MKYLLLILISTSTHAQTTPMPPPIREVWNIGNQFYPMVKESKRDVLISAGCEVKKLKCAAYKALSEIKKYKPTEAELQGGKSPGAVTCKNYFKSEILILKDAKQNENAFCKFSDGSLVSASAL